MSPPPPLPEDLGGGGRAPVVQRCAGMHALCVPHPGRRLQLQRVPSLKAPSRARTSKKMLSISEEARGMSRFTWQNKQKDLLYKSQSKHKRAKLVYKVVWEGSGERERNTEFLEHMIQDPGL